MLKSTSLIRLLMLAVLAGGLLGFAEPALAEIDPAEAAVIAADAASNAAEKAGTQY